MASWSCSFSRSVVWGACCLETCACLPGTCTVPLPPRQAAHFTAGLSTVLTLSADRSPATKRSEEPAYLLGLAALCGLRLRIQCFASWHSHLLRLIPSVKSHFPIGHTCSSRKPGMLRSLGMSLVRCVPGLARLPCALPVAAAFRRPV